MFFQAEAIDNRYQTGKINFRGVKSNFGGGYDGVSTFTASKAGLNYFTFTLLSDNTDLDQEAQFRKNGANLDIGARDGSKLTTPITSSMEIELSKSVNRQMNAFSIQSLGVAVTRLDSLCRGLA